jgi:signal-transduction protein with cAMP-binding, CBS, and nucleotidyltransferase domain
MEIIQKISLFQSLTNKQKFNLANSIKMAKFKENKTIFEAG